jgi:hypothetical protein
MPRFVPKAAGAGANASGISCLVDTGVLDPSVTNVQDALSVLSNMFSPADFVVTPGLVSLAAPVAGLWTDQGTYIYPNNYTNFGIKDDGKVGMVGNVDLVLITNDLERLRITSTGDVIPGNLLANRLVATGGSKELVSSDLINWVVEGNGAKLTDLGDGRVEISLDSTALIFIHNQLLGRSAASCHPDTSITNTSNVPGTNVKDALDYLLALDTTSETFVDLTIENNLTIESLSPNRLVATNGSKNLVSSDLINWVEEGTGTDVIDLGNGKIRISLDATNVSATSLQLNPGSNVKAIDMNVGFDTTGAEYSYYFGIDEIPFIEMYAESDGTGGIDAEIIKMLKCALFEKRGTATGQFDTYDSYCVKFRGSVWDQSGIGQAENRVASINLEANAGLDGSEPYKLVIKDNAGNRCFTFNFTEDKHGIVVGSDWAGTWSGLPFLAYKDHNGGYITRVHNISAGASSYAGMQFQNDLNRNFEIALGGGSRGDAWADVGWIWGGSNVNKIVVGVNAIQRMALTATGLRVQPDITINDGALVPLDIRTASAVTPPSLLGATVAAFIGPSNAQISIISSNSLNSRLYFGDTDSETVGGIEYNHSTNTMTFRTDAGSRMWVDSTDFTIDVDVVLNTLQSSRLIATDGSKKLVSSDLVNWVIAGNGADVTDLGDGRVEISLDATALIFAHNQLVGRDLPNCHPASSISNDSTASGTTVADALDIIDSNLSSQSVHNNLNGRDAAGAHPDTSITNSSSAPGSTVKAALDYLYASGCASLDPSRLVATDTTSGFVSTDLVNWVTGTVNQVYVTDDGDGSITLSLPQDIDPGASVTFKDITVDATAVVNNLFANYIEDASANIGYLVVEHALTLDTLTPNRLVASDGSKNLVSSDLVNWVTGTLNQINITDDGDGSITLSLPQDIDIGASVHFDNLLIDSTATINQLYVTDLFTNTLNIASQTASRLASFNSSKDLVSTNLSSWINGTSSQVYVTDGGDGSVTLSLPQDIDTTSTVTFGGMSLYGNLEMNSNTILNLNGIQLAEFISGDSTSYTPNCVLNAQIPAGASIGDVVSYGLCIGGTSVLAITGILDGSGGLSDTRVDMPTPFFGSKEDGRVQVMSFNKLLQDDEYHDFEVGITGFGWAVFDYDGANRYAHFQYCTPTSEVKLIDNTGEVDDQDTDNKFCIFIAPNGKLRIRNREGAAYKCAAFVFATTDQLGE